MCKEFYAPYFILFISNYLYLSLIISNYTSAKKDVISLRCEKDGTDPPLTLPREGVVSTAICENPVASVLSVFNSLNERKGENGKRKTIRSSSHPLTSHPPPLTAHPLIRSPLITNS